MEHYLRKRDGRWILRYAMSVLLMCRVILPSFAQDVVCLSYEDNFVPSNGRPLKLPMLSKKDRLKSNAGVISATINSYNEQVVKCMNYAMSVWENQIQNCESISIELNEGKIESDIKTDVLYTNYNGVYLPSALYAYKTNLPNTGESNGIITINENTDWDYSLGDNISDSGKNLTFALMRAIARILGFGSSVNINDDGEYYFACRRGYSVFDNLISDTQGAKLNTIRLMGGDSNPYLKKYIESNSADFFVNVGNSKYELQSPPYNKSIPPFTYLKDDDSLMRAVVDEGSYAFSIDSATADILNELGWNVAVSSSVKIISDELGESGIGSAYVDHIFRIDYRNVKPQNPKWELVLPLVSGGKETQVLKDNGLTCSVPAICEEDENCFEINQDGDIEAVLRFSCTIDGKTVVADPYRIYLELKPYIESATVVKIVDHYPVPSYDAHFKAKYRGTLSLTVSVEEEYSSKLKTVHVYEPYIATGVVEYIKSRTFAWMHFIATNKYGESTYTIELDPDEILDDGPVTSIESIKSEFDSYTCFEVYNLNGVKVVSLDDAKGLENIHGIFIIKCFEKDNNFKIIKYIGL